MSITNCSHGVLLIHKGFDTIDHVLDKLFLRFSKSSSVRDIEDTIVGLGMLSMDTSDLDFVLGGDSVESFFISHQFWKLDMHRGSHGSTEVGWA